MPTHRSKRAIAQVLWYAWIIEHGSLHYTSREDYLVARGVVVCLMCVSDEDAQRCRACTQAEITNVDRICRHSPFITVRGLTQSGPFARNTELGDGERVSEEGRAGDVDICIIFFQSSRVPYIWTFRGVAYLLYDVVD